MSIDISELLKPINDSLLCGEDYSFSNEFHEIKKARTQDDLLLDQGDWVAERKQADWDFVAKSVSTLLIEKTKDIRLLTWVIEAWTHLNGFEGMVKGITLTHTMLNQYWQDIHPIIEDDDLDQRIGLLQGLINQLPMLLKKVPLTNTAPYYNLLDYDNFLYHENIRRKQTEEYESQSGPSELEQFDQAIFNTSKTFQYSNYQEFNSVLTEWNVLKQTLDHLMGLDSPSFAAIDSAFETIHSTLRKIYKAEAFGTGLAPSQEQAAVITTPSMENQVPVQIVSDQPMFQPQAQTHLANREQAMKVLQEIAEYFQANEPHSPVSYMLQKTIKWSQMPLHEWLAQVIKDEHPLQMVQEMLGVQPKNEYE
ncbi:TPA: type VI secretion system protein TssA [Acinetobacter baumannii]